MDNLDHLLAYLIALPSETEWVEFKMNNGDRDSIGKYCSGLANSALLADQHAGYLVFGVEDKTHKLNGTDLTLNSLKKGNEDFSNWLHNRMEPNINIDFLEHEQDDRSFLIIKIYPTFNCPVSFNKIAYIRVGSSLRKLSNEKAKEQALWQKCAGATFEQSIAKPDLGVAEVLSLLDIAAYYELLALPIETDELRIIDRLISERMVQQEADGSYSIKNLGAILLAKNIQKFDSVSRRAIRVIQYDGKGRINALDEREGSYGYANGFVGMLSYVESHIPKREIIDRALRRDEFAYPVVAIREFIANAIIHQDFSIKGTGPVVEIFEDRIEISNPGKLLMDVMRLMDNPPISRNEELARFMRRCRLCEERGSGIDRAIFLLEKARLPAPEFQITDTHVKVVLRPQKTFGELTHEERSWICYWHCCLCHLEGENMTNKSLRERLGVSKHNYPQVSQVIAETKDREWIKDFDPDNKAPRYANYIPFWA